MDPVKLYDAEGRSVTVRSAVEATNLRSAGYSDTPPTAVEVPAADPAGGAVQYDPADHTVEQVQAFLAEHPEHADAVLESERQGKNRAGLVG